MMLRLKASHANNWLQHVVGVGCTSLIFS